MEAIMSADRKDAQIRSYHDPMQAKKGAYVKFMMYAINRHRQKDNREFEDGENNDEKPMQPREIKFVFGFHGKEITNE